MSAAFGTNDVTIPFYDGIKILIGENGLGKTQVLNIFYYTLERNFFRLDEFNFEKDIILVFIDDKITYKIRSVLSDNIKNDVSELFLDTSIKFNLKKIEDEK